jgi:hypothetical protein
MYSGITKIYDRKTVGHVFTKPVQIEGKTRKFVSQKVFSSYFTFLQLGDGIVCVRISMHPFWRVCGNNLNIVSMYDVSPVVQTSNISSCKKKLFFSFRVFGNNSVFVCLWTIQFSCVCEQVLQVGPLVFLLQMFVITEDIMKRPVFGESWFVASYTFGNQWLPLWGC